ncbi:bacteriocin [Shewanella dokdonensis]|uniref:Bacteriocin n=1 Tax=Shewanella dokdonensis TaxID=712036 RepID=A0ABX8DGC5_9GAMM|nr:bacteriocin [Shewanella dokdonensis]MCL1073994.1 bacteriocin [Shewanella dokdonensis]QVK23754.1 bacteriocin [Shewanella dokdonensis]
MNTKFDSKKIEELTVSELQSVTGGSGWLGHLDSFYDHQAGLEYGYQTGGSELFPTCDRIQ